MSTLDWVKTIANGPNIEEIFLSAGTLSICSVKSKPNKSKNKADADFTQQDQYTTNTDNNLYVNLVQKIKHFPPANKEWVNSIYVYNKATKNFSALDKNLNRLMRSYLNLYSNKLRTKVRKHRSRRFEIRKARRLMNRILFSRAELKHTNDKIIITIYIYNADKKYLFNKIKNMPALYKAHKSDKLKRINTSKNLFIKKTYKTSSDIKSKINEHKKSFFFLENNVSDKNAFYNINTYKKHFYFNYTKKFLRKDIISVFYKQMLAFNKSKFEKKYLVLLTNHLTEVYKKKIEFNFVNIKHLYLDSYIFSTALITKLKKLAKIKKSFLKGVKRFLDMFKVPNISSLDVYNDIYNRKMTTQNVNIDNKMCIDAHNVSAHNSTSGNDMEIYKKPFDNVEYDILDNSFKIAKLFTDRGINITNSLHTLNYVSTITKAFKSTKYILINGIRLEIAGRFTKRSSAARSVFKIRNKGSIKNKDSSYKGLPAVLLKGYAKSNLQYNKSNSKVRGGSFGIKSWLSGA